MMSILLDANRWPEFHAYIAEQTSAVTLNIDYDDYIVFCPGPVDNLDSDDDLDTVEQWQYPYTQSCSLHVKEEFADMWMCKGWLGTDRWREGMLQWEKSLGLEKRKKARCIIRPHA